MMAVPLLSPKVLHFLSWGRKQKYIIKDLSAFLSVTDNMKIEQQNSGMYHICDLQMAISSTVVMMSTRVAEKAVFVSKEEKYMSLLEN